MWCHGYAERPHFAHQLGHRFPRRRGIPTDPRRRVADRSQPTHRKIGIQIALQVEQVALHRSKRRLRGDAGAPHIVEARGDIQFACFRRGANGFIPDRNNLLVPRLRMEPVTGLQFCGRFGDVGSQRIQLPDGAEEKETLGPASVSLTYNRTSSGRTSKHSS